MRRFLTLMTFSALLAQPIIVTTPGEARADWAIAFGQNGTKAWAFGSSVKPDDKAAARKGALSRCRNVGPNCKIVLDGDGGCVALAVGLTDNAWAAEQRDTRQEAATAALKECLHNSDGDCEIKKTLCEQ